MQERRGGAGGERRIKQTVIRDSRFLLLGGVLFLVGCVYMLVPVMATAEPLPYEVSQFTNSWWYIPIGDFLYFSARTGSDAGLWKSDGTEQGTRQVTENIFSRDMMIDFQDEKLGDFVFFVADQNDNGENELYVANEADGKNYLIEEFPDPLFYRNIYPLKVYNNKFYFLAHTYDYGFEIWQTDGSAHTATLLKDIYPGDSGSSVAELVEFEGYLFFGADDNTHGLELWISDGTGPRTLMLADIYNVPLAPGDYTTSSGPMDFVILGDKLLFTANDGVHGRELWSVDSVAMDAGGVVSSNVAMVKDFTPGDDAGDPYDSSPDDMLVYEGRMYFTIFREDLYLVDYDLYWELWETDGTEAGTTRIGPTYNGSERIGRPSGMIAMDGKLFLSCVSEDYGHELFYVDLSSDDKSLHLLKDIYPGVNEYGSQNGSWPAELTVVSGSSIGKEDIFYFTAESPVYGRELWTSDGTSAGTHLVKDLAPGSDSSSIDELHALGSKLLFRLGGAYLWAIDREKDGGAVGSSGDFPWNLFLPIITGRGIR